MLGIQAGEDEKQLAEECGSGDNNVYANGRSLAK